MQISIPNVFKKFSLVQMVLIFLQIQTAAAQDINNKRGIEVAFTSRKTEQLSNELASNVLRVKNNSGKSYDFSVSISAPADWKLIQRRTKMYSVLPYDSVFIPVNLIGKKTSNGNVSHIVNASLINDEDIQFASAIWYLTVKKESNWNAAATLNKIFLLTGSDTARFGIKLQNTGNAEEKIKINFVPDRRLRVFQQNSNREIRFFNTVLPVNADTIIYFTAEKLKPMQKTFREDFSAVAEEVKADVQSLRVTVENEPDESTRVRTWRTTIDFIRTGTEAKLKDRSYAALPLTIEGIVENIMSNSTILNLSMYGSTTFAGDRTLMYRYQTYFSNNFYSYSPFLGNSHYIGYVTPKSSIELGDISGNSNFGFTSSGRGLKASHEVFRGNTLGAFYLQSPRFWSDMAKTDYGISHELRLGRNSIDNYLQFTKNDLLKFTGRQYSNHIRLALSRSHSLLINSAFSEERYNATATPVTKTGFAYLVNYSGAFRKFNLNVTNSFGSRFNTNYRGIRSAGLALGYRLNRVGNLQASYYTYKQNPQYITSAGFLLNARPTETEQYELMYTYTPATYSATFKLRHLYTDSYNLRSEANGGGVDFRPRQVGDIRFFVSLYGYYNKLPDYSIDPYFSSQLRSTFRYRGLTSSIRYTFGPYQTFQQVLFATTKINSQSVFTNTNIKQWLIKDKLSFEPSVVYSYETLFKRNRFSIRPEVYFLPKNGLEFRFYSQYINNNQKNNPYIDLNNYRDVDQSMSSSSLFFGFGVKKNIGIPVSAKKYHTLKISVFKDINGNGKQDKNELGLKNVLVNIKSISVDTLPGRLSVLQEKGESFVTDENGKIIYKNLPKGEYKISIVPLTEQAGFFAGSEKTISLTSDQSVAIPLNEGSHLTGVLAVQRDMVAADYDRKIDISRIRVTATDSLGKTYSTLTDSEGRFTLRLPVGVYAISINESALPDNFELQQKTIVVEMLTVADNYNITFNIIERKRKLNIRKFDQQGKLIQNKDNKTKLKNRNE